MESGLHFKGRSHPPAGAGMRADLWQGAEEPSDNGYSKGMLARTPELGSDAISLTNGSFPSFLVTSFLNLCLKDFLLLIASSERLYLVGVAFVDSL